jgi:hypothetical protein
MYITKTIGLIFLLVGFAVAFFAQKKLTADERSWIRLQWSWTEVILMILVMALLQSSWPIARIMSRSDWSWPLIHGVFSLLLAFVIGMHYRRMRRRRFPPGYYTRQRFALGLMWLGMSVFATGHAYDR